MEKRLRRMRMANCAVLLVLLAFSACLGRREPAQQVNVPVFFEPLEEVQAAGGTARETGERLRQERSEALAALDSVIVSPQAEADAVQRAMEKKTQIAAWMEREAALEAALAQIGVQAAAVISGEDCAAVFVGVAEGADEKLRMQILDLTSALCGLDAQAIKIILVKK